MALLGSTTLDVMSSMTLITAHQSKHDRRSVVVVAVVVAVVAVVAVEADGGDGDGRGGAA